MEASGAAAGLLSPQVDLVEPGPFFDLALESRALHARWSEELAAETGIDVGYRRCGTLRCSFAKQSSLERARRWQAERGLPLEPIDAAGSASRTAGRVSRGLSEAVFFSDEAMVDSALLTLAVARSADQRGARILSETAVRRLRLREGSCVGVETDSGVFESSRVVDAAGA